MLTHALLLSLCKSFQVSALAVWVLYYMRERRRYIPLYRREESLLLLSSPSFLLDSLPLALFVSAATFVLVHLSTFHHPRKVFLVWLCFSNLAPHFFFQHFLSNSAQKQ